MSQRSRLRRLSERPNKHPWVCSRRRVSGCVVVFVTVSDGFLLVWFSGLRKEERREQCEPIFFYRSPTSGFRRRKEELIYPNYTFLPRNCFLSFPNFALPSSFVLTLACCSVMKLIDAPHPLYHRPTRTRILPTPSKSIHPPNFYILACIDLVNIFFAPAIISLASMVVFFHSVIFSFLLSIRPSQATSPPHTTQFYMCPYVMKDNCSDARQSTVGRTRATYWTQITFMKIKLVTQVHCKIHKMRIQEHPTTH